MEQRTLRGLEFELRPHGPGRIGGAAFLLAWLCFWSVGELFALSIVVHGAVSLWKGEPPGSGQEPLELAPALGVGLFLLAWLALWTVGGIAAWRELLRLTVARDRLIVDPTGLTVEHRLGPFCSTRRIAVDRTLRVSVRPPRFALSAESPRETVELSTLGTTPDRERVAEALRRELRLESTEPAAEAAPGLPEGWQEIVDPEGGVAVVADLGTRRTQARVATAVASVVGLVALLLVRESARNPAGLALSAVVTAAAAGLGWGALWLAHGRLEWRLGWHRLTLRRRFGRRVWDVFEAVALELTERRDSDGDSWYALEGVGPDAPPRGRRSIVRTIHDPTVPRRLGGWLAARARVPFTDRTTPAARDAEVRELLARLRASGRFGRAAAGWIERVASRRRPGGPDG